MPGNTSELSDLIDAIHKEDMLSIEDTGGDRF